MTTRSLVTNEMVRCSPACFISIETIHTTFGIAYRYAALLTDTYSFLERRSALHS